MSRRARSRVPIVLALLGAVWIAGILLTAMLASRAGETADGSAPETRQEEEAATGASPPADGAERPRAADEEAAPRTAAAPEQAPEQAAPAERPEVRPVAEDREEAAEAPPPEPAVYDPLGKDPEPGELTETDRKRAELAAFRFVQAGYGVALRGEEGRLEYVDGVNATVAYPEEFWPSPGGRVLSALADRIEGGGVSNSASFEGLRAGREDADGELPATARFALDEGDGEKAYEQELTLVRWGAVWRVRHAEAPKEVSG